MLHQRVRELVVIRADLAQDPGPHGDVERVDERSRFPVEDVSEHVQLEPHADDRGRRQHVRDVEAEGADALG